MCRAADPRGESNRNLDGSQSVHDFRLRDNLAMQAQKMKRTRMIAAVLVAVGLIFSLVGFFYAYYFSWVLSTPGVSAEAQRYYDLLSRGIGIPSLILFGISAVA